MGECIVSCKLYNRQKGCSTKDVSCLGYAAYIFRVHSGQSGNFYCNVLSFPSNSFEQATADTVKICNNYNKMLSYSSKFSFCRVTCSFLYGN